MSLSDLITKDSLLKKYRNLYDENKEWGLGAAVRWFTPFYPNYSVSEITGYNKNFKIAVCSVETARYFELQGHPSENITIFVDNQTRYDSLSERYQVEVCNPFTKDKSNGFEKSWNQQKSHIHKTYKDYFDHTAFCNLYASQQNTKIGGTYLKLVEQITKKNRLYTLAQTPQSLITAIENKLPLKNYSLSFLENNKNAKNSRGGGYIMSTYFNTKNKPTRPTLLKPFNSSGDAIFYDILKKLIGFNEWNDYELTGKFTISKKVGDVIIGFTGLKHEPFVWGQSNDPKVLPIGPKVLTKKFINHNDAHFQGTTAKCLLPSGIVVSHPSWKTIKDAQLMAEWIHRNPIRIFILYTFGFSRNTYIRFLKAFPVNEINGYQDFPNSYALTLKQKEYLSKYQINPKQKNTKNGVITIWKKPKFGIL